jgi:hypothetical protein
MNHDCPVNIDLHLADDVNRGSIPMTCDTNGAEVLDAAQFTESKQGEQA